MKRFHSIRWRLQLWYGLLFAVLLAGFAITGYSFKSSVEVERMDDELALLAASVNRTGRAPPPPVGSGTKKGDTSPGGSTKKNETTRTPAEIITPGMQQRGYYYAIWRKNGPAFAGSD